MDKSNYDFYKTDKEENIFTTFAKIVMKVIILLR